MHPDGNTIVYGIIGNPVSHSLSPLMHNRAFKAHHLNNIYIPLHTDDLAAALQGLRGMRIGGASVTIPFKEQVIELLDEIDPVARKIGAVNTIVAQRQDSEVILYGTNTDWMGSNQALATKIELQGRRAVILGAGGAARAIGFGLLEAGAQIEIKSRAEGKGRALAEQLNGDWSTLHGRPLKEAHILVNATSVGMEPEHNVSPVKKELLAGYSVVMDIVYAPLQTKLLEDAIASGCTAVNGLEMLLYQGVVQFELWTGLKAPVDVMRQELLQAVA